MKQNKNKTKQTTNTTVPIVHVNTSKTLGNFNPIVEIHSHWVEYRTTW